MAWETVCKNYQPSTWIIGYCKRCKFHESDHELRPKNRG